MVIIFIHYFELFNWSAYLFQLQWDDSTPSANLHRLERTVGELIHSFKEKLLNIETNLEKITEETNQGYLFCHAHQNAASNMKNRYFKILISMTIFYFRKARRNAINLEFLASTRRYWQGWELTHTQWVLSTTHIMIYKSMKVNA